MIPRPRSSLLVFFFIILNKSVECSEGFVSHMPDGLPEQLWSSGMARLSMRTPCVQQQLVHRTVIDLHASLHSNGFHRQLLLGIPSLSDLSLHCKQAGHGHAAGIHIVQPVSPALYFDPFELQSSAVVRDAHMEVDIVGDIDLEMPASVAPWTVALLSLQPLKDQARNITLPLHAKYPAPQNLTRTGWQDMLISGHQMIHLDSPAVLLECKEGQDMQPGCVESGTIQCLWMMPRTWDLHWKQPAGNAAHLPWVGAVTLWVQVVCTAAIFAAML